VSVLTMLRLCSSVCMEVDDDALRRKARVIRGMGIWPLEIPV
jgi:hypothetical protein